MTPENVQRIAAAMAARAGQWKTRVGIGAIIAGTFFSLTSPLFAAGWFGLYCILQLLEARLHPDKAFAHSLSPDRYAVACLVLVASNNAIFGFYGATEVMSGTTIGLVCGSLLMGGAIVNAVLVSPGSRPLVLAALLPQTAYLLLLPFGALRAGLSPLEAAQMGLAGAMMAGACMAMWSRFGGVIRAMESAQRHAEEASRAKSQFLATISHEIRTPLNGVLGMAQAMRADDLSNPQRERLDVITCSGQSLMQIVGDVLDLSKIEAGKLTLEEAVFDLGDLIDRTQAIFRGAADSKGLDFDVTISPPADRHWRGDPTRLHQILGNLISNAVKFTETGSVRVHAGMEDQTLVVTVSDTGPGVTPGQLPRLFKKFVQADASTTRRYGGTGLGLSICGELVRLMGGAITARHVTPHGLAFEVRVPLEAVAPDGDLAALDAAAASSLDGSDLRVLAAEDHPVNRQVLTLLLSQAGITPHVVENGAEAVAAWRDRDWDLILMDVQMPVMDGPTAAGVIRSEEAATGRPRTPIIALTANVLTQQTEEYRQAGMDKAVGKPIQIDVLLDAIATAVTTDERRKAA